MPSIDYKKVKKGAKKSVINISGAKSVFLKIIYDMVNLFNFDMKNILLHISHIITKNKLKPKNN